MSGPLTGLAILIIGASQFAHNGYLITTLHNDLQDQGATVVTYGACATVPEAWMTPTPVWCGTAVRVGPGAVVEDKSKSASSWSVSDLIHKYHPRLVLIGIADTLAGYRQGEIPETFIKQQTHMLAERVASEGVACIWLGTTWGSEGGPLGKNFTRVKELSGLLAKNVAPCEYLDSLPFSKPGEWPTIDGQHHTAAAYELWGHALTQAILQSATAKALEKSGTP